MAVRWLHLTRRSGYRLLLSMLVRNRNWLESTSFEAMELPAVSDLPLATSFRITSPSVRIIYGWHIQSYATPVLDRNFLSENFQVRFKESVAYCVRAKRFGRNRFSPAKRI